MNFLKKLIQINKTNTHKIINLCGIKLKLFDKQELVHKWQEEYSYIFNERDCLLVIDDQIPETDKHAGAKSTMGLIQTYLEIGLNVLFLPDNFTNFHPYDENLRKNQVKLLTDYNISNFKTFKLWLKKHSTQINHILLSRPYVAIRYLSEIKKYKNIKIIYYGQDLHFLREMRTFEVTREKKHLSLSKNYKKMEYDIIEKADVIYFPSVVEKNIIKKDFPSKTVEVIPVYTYTLENIPEPKTFEERKDILFVGNFKHIPNVDGLTWFVNKIFDRVIEKIPDVKLNIAGSNINDIILKLKSPNINILGFVSDEKLSELYKNSRVIIAPLRFGAGMKGKVIEAIYNQIPVITTHIGAEGIENLNDIITIAYKECDFADELVDLYTNKSKNEYVVKNSLNIIKNQFSSTITFEILNRGLMGKKSQYTEDAKCYQ